MTELIKRHQCYYSHLDIINKGRFDHKYISNKPVCFQTERQITKRLIWMELMLREQGVDPISLNRDLKIYTLIN